MPRGYRHLQLSFSGGEISPEMWSRHDDPRFRSGAARLYNMICGPRGSASRRPGFQHVRAVKEDATAARLLPFRYSRDQTVAIEMGVAPIGGTDYGYFRFHTNGGTLLHTLPPTYKAPRSVVSINTGTEEWNIGASQPFADGDPIVVTMEATTTTFTVTASTPTINVAAHGFQVDEAVMFRVSGGNLPQFTRSPNATPERIESGRLYYVTLTTANTFEIALTRGGPSVVFTTLTGSGTLTVACTPSPSDGAGGRIPFDPNRVFYAIDAGGGGTTIKIAATRADALAGNAFDWTSIGSSPVGDLRVHYAYQNGDTVFAGVNAYYCHRVPWGIENSLYLNLNDHLETGHGPGGAADYWQEMPGSSSTVTFTLATDRVNWTAHGLTDGDPVSFSSTGTLPTGITAGTTYYVRNSTVNDFQIAASLPGPIVDLAGAPTGVATAFANGIYEVPHFYSAAVLFEINFVQSNDVLTLVHPTRPVAELQRLGASHWRRKDVVFGPSVTAPTSIEVVEHEGEGHKPASVTAVTPAVISFAPTNHLYSAGERVQVVDVGDIPNGHYVIETTTATTITLKDFEDGSQVGSTTTTIVATSRVRSSNYAENWNVTYAVTALDADGKESEISEQVTVSNNLLAIGANNMISWAPVGGAAKYRVYKDENGLLGFIGEVDAPAVSLVDNNIAPDFSVSPPIHDSSLRHASSVGFDLTDNTVSWTAHGLPEGLPVVFDTDETLPNEISREITFYVANPGTDTFELRDGNGDLVDLTGSEAGIHTAVAGLFPSAVAYFEQRRFFGGPLLLPQDFWMTVSGTESSLNYNIPVQDSNRIYNRLAARERSQIRHAVPVGHLLLFTDSAEFRLTPLNSDALTPGSTAARAPTQIGVSAVAPVVVNNAVLFPAARGGHIREMGFLDTVGDYVTGDVSLRAAHLFDNRTILQMAYQQAPHPVVWAVSSAGTLLGFSYMPEEQLAGWHEHQIDGTFESCIAISEGDEDRLYVITQREGVRYVERLGPQRFATRDDAFFVDFGATYQGTAVSSVFVPHLASKAVSFLADGVIGTGTVAADGTLTLPVASSTVHVGLAYTNQLRTLPLGMQVDAALGSGRTRNVNQVWLRLSESGAFLAGESLTSLSRSDDPPTGQLLTDLVQVVTLGAWNLEGQVYVQASEPLPLTIAGITLEVATGG